MPIQQLDTQGPGQQGGLLLNLLRLVGQLGGQNKLRPDDPYSAGPMDTTQSPKYKADWWDSLYGGQAGRLNAAGDIDSYNRRAALQDLQKQLGMYTTADVDRYKQLSPAMVDRSEMLGESGRREAVANVKNEGNIEGVEQSGQGGMKRLKALGNALKGADVAEKKLGVENINVGNDEAKALRDRLLLEDTLPDYVAGMKNASTAGRLISEGDLALTGMANSPMALQARQNAAMSDIQSKASQSAAELNKANALLQGTASPEFMSTASQIPTRQAAHALVDPLQIIPHMGSIVNPRTGGITSMGINDQGGMGWNTSNINQTNNIPKLDLSDPRVATLIKQMQAARQLGLPSSTATPTR